VSAAGWEPVIGLEVHVHLKTESKLFCRCPVRYGREPNHQVCPVCLALPGALPVLNRGAVERAVRVGLAVGGSVNPHSVFARKNYFYPDLPKGYQISQYEDPLVSGGGVEIATAEGGVRTVPLTRIHMEEDAGKSVHGDWETAGESHMDLNRAGVPLVEIVSEPELRSADEAGAFLRALRAILRYAGVSDADMEKGQMRCDVNLSLRRPGSGTLGTRTETKNLNSFRSVQGAIQAEMERQAEILDDGGEIVQATMLFDADAGRTQLMRVKENADDYRYFPDPDLIPLDLDPAWIARLREALPELPGRKRVRFQESYGLSLADAQTLTETVALADFFEAAVRAHGTARSVANWLLRDVAAVLKEGEGEIEATRLEPGALAALIGLVEAGRVTPQSARDVLRELASRGGDPEALIRERGLEAVSDSDVLETAADQVLAENPEMAERYRSGETKVLNFLMGQVMKRTQGKASPPLVRAILARKLEG
jgi:aspartyl-tRNA(Asn)/glutamyl-tRNA(Gln) amidotransferase subunit B